MQEKDEPTILGSDHRPHYVRCPSDARRLRRRLNQTSSSIFSSVLFIEKKFRQQKVSSGRL